MYSFRRSVPTLVVLRDYNDVDSLPVLDLQPQLQIITALLHFMMFLKRGASISKPDTRAKIPDDLMISSEAQDVNTSTIVFYNCTSCLILQKTDKFIIEQLDQELRNTTNIRKNASNSSRLMEKIETSLP